MNNMSDGKTDGLALMYLKNGTLYPVGLTRDQLEALDLIIGVAIQNKIHIFTEQPMGKAISVLKG